MRTRIYVNGKPTWSENEPAFARVQGHGGSQLGYFSGTTLVAKQRPPKVKLPRQALSVTRPRKDVPA